MILELTTRGDAEQVIRYADKFAAMGAQPRLRIMQLLLTAHLQGLAVGDIQDELGVPASTLSHHLDKLKHEELVKVRRAGWRTHPRFGVCDLPKGRIRVQLDPRHPC